MSTVKIKTNLNADEFPYEGQVFTQRSLTLPDRSMSMRQILTRYAQGMPIIGSMREPIYSDDPDDEGIDTRTLDLVDKQQILYEQKQIIDENEKRRKKGEKKRADDAERSRTEKAVEDALSKKEIPPVGTT